MASVAQPWLISKFVDPVFSICVGVSAAVLRIRREEKERFPNQDLTYSGLWQKGLRMSRHYFGYDIKR